MAGSWEVLTAALEELDTIRAQVGESRSLERTARFYSLVRIKQVGPEHGGHVATVIELSGGWVIIHWTHDPKSVGLYSSILSAQKALCSDDVYLLALEDTSERRACDTRRANTRGEALTDAERKILVALGHGLSNSEIATSLGLALPTVKNTLGQVYRKLGVQDRLQAALRARDLDMSGADDVDTAPVKVE